MCVGQSRHQFVNAAHGQDKVVRCSIKLLKGDGQGESVAMIYDDAAHGSHASPVASFARCVREDWSVDC